MFTEPVYLPSGLALIVGGMFAKDARGCCCSLCYIWVTFDDSQSTVFAVRLQLQPVVIGHPREWFALDDPYLFIGASSHTRCKLVDEGSGDFSFTDGGVTDYSGGGATDTVWRGTHVTFTDCMKEWTRIAPYDATGWSHVSGPGLGLVDMIYSGNPPPAIP